MGKMFQTVDVTWNPFTGCGFQCQYCWARELAEGRLKYTERYKDGFRPAFHPRELSKHFRTGQFVGVSLMGDISFAPRDVVADILTAIADQPRVLFLFCTKNPAIYSEWGFEYPENLYLGTTIETDRNHGLSKAPAPVERYKELRDLQHARKFVSIEPIMDFNLDTMVSWMKEIRPAIIEVGLDNYGKKLPEPPAWKVKRLLENLRSSCHSLVEKPSLERLMK